MGFLYANKVDKYSFLTHEYEVKVGLEAPGGGARGGGRPPQMFSGTDFLILLIPV